MSLSVVGHLRSNHFQKSNFIKLINDNFCPLLFFFLSRIHGPLGLSWSEDSLHKEDLKLVGFYPWTPDSLFEFKTFVRSISINSYLFIFTATIFSGPLVFNNVQGFRTILLVRSFVCTISLYLAHKMVRSV